MSNIKSFISYDNVKSLIKSLLVTCKSGVNIYRFQKIYEEDIQDKIPYKELGYSNLEQFIISMPDAVDFVYNRDGTMILKAKCDSSNSHLIKLVGGQKVNKSSPRYGNKKSRSPRWSSSTQHLNHSPQWSSSSQYFKPPRVTQTFRPPKQHIAETEPKEKKILPAAIKDRLNTLISKYSSGLESDDLLKAYYHEYKDAVYQNDLSYMDYGFKCSEELFLSIPDIFIIQNYDSKKLFFPMLPQVEVFSPKVKEELESNKVIDKNYSPIEIQDFIEYIDNTPFIHVAIGEVYNPSNFSLIIDDEALDELMEKMQEFYEGPILEEWKLHNKHVVLMHPVVVMMAGAFNRAVITSFKELDLVEVLCVDYGSTCTVSKSELLYLHQKFFSLPTQAVTASLYGIKPVGDINWNNCRPVSERFLQLVAEKDCIFAEIMETEAISGKLGVRLINTENPEKDVCINDMLVLEEFAQSTNKKSRNNINVKKCNASDNQSGSLNKGSSNENGVTDDRKSCVDQWLQHLPNSSSNSDPLVSINDGYISDALMHLDAATQSIHDKRRSCISEIEDIDFDEDSTKSLVVLNTCVKALETIKRVLLELES